MFFWFRNQYTWYIQYFEVAVSFPGRITEFKIGRPGHSVSIACSTHRACRKVALIGHLPVSFQALGDSGGSVPCLKFNFH